MRNVLLEHQFSNDVRYIVAQAESCASVLEYEGINLDEGGNVTSRTLGGLGDLLREIVKRAEHAEAMFNALIKEETPIKPADMAATTQEPEVQS